MQRAADSRGSVTEDAVVRFVHCAEFVVLGAWVCMACACGKTEVELQPGPRAPGASAPPSAVPAVQAPRPTAAPNTNPPIPLVPVVPQDRAKRDLRKRDFSAELVSILGLPSSCLKPRAASTGPSTTDLSVTAHVMPSGSVSRGEAASAQLDANELACVRRLVESVHFAQPIDNAPFSVSATVKIQLHDANGGQARAPVQLPVQLQGPPNPYAPPKVGLPPPHVDEPGNVPTPAPPTVYPSAPGNVPTPAPPTVYPSVPGNVPTPAPPAQMP